MDFYIGIGLLALMLGAIVFSKDTRDNIAGAAIIGLVGAAIIGLIILLTGGVPILLMFIFDYLSNSVVQIWSWIKDLVNFVFS